MTIANIVKPWSFTNNVETADATKVNANFDVAIAALNEAINAINLAAGSRASLNDRLSVVLNDDGTLKSSGLPVGSYDTRTSRTITADDALTENDSVILVDTTAGNINLQLLSAGATSVCPTIVNIGATGYAANIVPDFGDTVMTLSTVSLTVGGESIKIAPHGTNWYRIG